MLKKFITIKSVGKFRNCNAGGDIDFRKLTLIYAENGRGKTTLAAILRSVQSGDPLFVQERRTVNSKSSPSIELLCDSGRISFSSGVWSCAYPKLVIFDSSFVSENVYSGDFVELDHKKRLYQVTIGSEGVLLAKRVMELDAKSRELAAKIKEKRDALAKKVPVGLTVEKFIQLQKDEMMDEKIEAKKKALKALENAEVIKAKSGFGRLSLPVVPDELCFVLGKTLEGVSSDVEKRVREHIKHHEMGEEGEGWLSRGLAFVSHEVCPFCEQGVKESVLLKTYQDFFSAAYGELKAAVKNLKENFTGRFSEKTRATLETTLVQNQANAEFWKSYTTVVIPELSFENERQNRLRISLENRIYRHMVWKKTNRPRMKSRPPLPTRFSAYLGGCFSVSYDLELRGDVLLVKDGERPGVASSEIRPSREAWLEFRRALDAINVWCWRSEYPNPGILDGTQWSLEITYPDRSVQAHGDNNYPGPEGMPTGQPEEPDTFQSFVGAVSRLLGKEPSE